MPTSSSSSRKISSRISPFLHSQSYSISPTFSLSLLLPCALLRHLNPDQEEDMAIKCISGSHKPALHTRPKEQLLNHVVDDIARENPELLYAELPVSPTSFDAGFRHVTYRDFANAINGMAWWLTCTLGPGGNFETLAYLGPNDLRHNILVLGAVKAGYKVSTNW